MSSFISQNEQENTFDKVIRIGYGLPVISFLYSHEASAFGCVNQQSAEAVRWQREKGNLVSVWSEDENHHVTIRYKDVNITTNFPVISISMKSIKIERNNIHQSFKYIQKIRNGEITVHNDRIYVIKLYGKYHDDGYGFGYYEKEKEVIVNYADAKIYKDTFIPFKKQRQILRAKEEAERKRLDDIRAEEEKKRIYLEKHTIRIPAQYMNKPNPWKKLPKVEAMKII
jgi:hypothetical protein